MPATTELTVRAPESTRILVRVVDGHRRPLSYAEVVVQTWNGADPPVGDEAWREGGGNFVQGSTDVDGMATFTAFSGEARMEVFRGQKSLATQRIQLEPGPEQRIEIIVR